MAKRKKSFRRSIRINGVLHNSPSFPLKAQADAWYQQKLKERHFVKFGFLSGSVPTFMEYSALWIQKRMKTYPRSTWEADDQRLRAYLLPYLAEIPMDRISRQKMREVLSEVTGEGKSPITRQRVVALSSKIFNDALNENPPLILSNPVCRMQFNDARRGTKKIVKLADASEAVDYMKCAAQCGPRHFIIALLGIGAMLRKSEKIPLKWKDLKPKRSILVVSRHCEQASLTIKPGTKAGCEESRDVHIPTEVLDLLLSYRAHSKFNRDNDFILADENGDWIRPRKFHDMVSEIHEKFGRKITDHALRHSGSALFVERTGNLQALKQQLGHKNISTTEIYSDMSGHQMAKLKESTSIGLAAAIENIDSVLNHGENKDDK